MAIAHPSQPDRSLARGLVGFLGYLALTLTLLWTSSQTVQAQGEGDDALRQGVKTAIAQGQRFLKSQQRGDGSFETGYTHANVVGANSLVGLALLTSGMEPSDPVIQKCLRYVRSQPPTTNTYDLGTAIMFYAAAGEAQDKPRIRQMAEILVRYQTPTGGWGYGYERDPIDSPPTSWDNSTSQFAILGLREAAFHTGMEIDQAIWRKARDHWLQTQTGPSNAVNGAGWGYKDNSPASDRGSMTAAGLASLEIINGFLVEDEQTPDGNLDCCGDAQLSKSEEAIDAGIRWMNQNIRIRSNPVRDGSSVFLFYYLYGLERAGKFTGQRFFGQTDWYREGAAFMVEGQSPVDSSWSIDQEGPVIGTSFCLLFLSKGLSPVLINKLQYGPRDPQSKRIVRPDWNRHRHDVSNLVDAISIRDDWPHYLSWQSLDMQVAAKGEGVLALQQAPISYLSGDQDLDSITEEEVALLRDYVQQGGFLFAVQNCDSTAFDEGFRLLITRMFPKGDYQLRKLDKSHDVYRSETPFLVDPPELWGVDFGCRTAIMYAPYDHACRWDKWMRNDSARNNNEIRAQIGKSILLGVNVVAYATNRELRDKLQRPTSVIALSDSESRGQLRIGRLKHTGGWNTAASAVTNLGRALQEKARVAVTSDSPVFAANDPALFECPILYMHGRKNFSLSPEETTQLKAYFDNGGFLMADACCGAKQFDQSFRTMIQQTFGQELKPIPADHEMFHSTQGYDVRQVKRRIPGPDQTSILSVGETIGEPLFEGIEIKGANGAPDRYAVVYSKYDISCALERQQTLACAGYLNEDAVKLAVNIVLYALYQ